MAEPQSDETRALAAWLRAAGVPHRITNSTNHSLLTAAGFPSLHVAPATNGRGRALDIAGPTPGRDTPELRAIFDAFLPVERVLHELVYAGAPFSIKRGKRVTPYAVAGHHDHVHVSVGLGVILRTPVQPAPPLLPFIFAAQEGHMFKDRDDADAFLVCFAYTTLLGRPFGEREGLPQLFHWIEVVRSQGANVMWQQIANSDEAKSYRAGR